MPSIPEALSQALQHHQAGHLDLAQQLYQRILAVDPHHAECHHLLGIVAYQSGRFDQAIACIRTALHLNPNAAAYFSNLGLAQEALGQLQDAAASYQQALLLRPDLAEPHCNLANAYLKLGQHSDAAIHYRLALGLKLNYADAHYGLGLALAGLAQPEEAMAHYRQALLLDPNHAEAHSSLANALLSQGMPEAAVGHFQLALRIRPNNPQSHSDLGNALLSLGRLDEALRCYYEALRLNPSDPMACNNLGVAFTGQENHAEAAKWYREAVRLNPRFREAYCNLGHALERQGKFHGALKCYDEVLREPTGADQTLVSKAHWVRSVLWLLLGKFERGWPEYEWRWSRPGITQRPFTQPVWDGSSLNGRTILLYAEQGLGDTLQFIRYTPLVKDCGGHVVLECQPALMRLLTGTSGIDDIFPVDAPPPPYDVQAALLSLPRILKTTLDSIPARVPYLRADAKLVEHWRRALQPLPGLKVGIAWQGSPVFPRDAQRSIPLACFEPLAAIDSVQLISLQKGHGADQVRTLENRLPVMDLGERVDEAHGALMDTAAIMMNLDLVISSDTVIPHLAGALGVPVWVALPGIPDWRWLLERPDSPWYPTMRLFRQKHYGQWREVFEEMAGEVRKTQFNRR